MTFKRRISKEDFTGFTGDNAYKKNLYSLQGDGSYKLDAEPDEDTANLITAKQAEKDRADAEAAKVAQLNTDLTAIRQELDTIKREKQTAKDNDNKKKGNFDEIEKDYQDRLTAKDAELTEKDKKHQTTIKNIMINGEADAMAVDIFTIGKEMSHKIVGRLDVDFSVEPPKLIVTKDGKATSMTLADLRAELVANPALKPIIKASNASGGGANGGHAGGAGASGKAFKDLSEAERVTLFRENPTEFRRLDALNKSGATV